jgi:hypothetical protein
MNTEITKDSPYHALKDWFEKTDLPSTCDGVDMYHMDVKQKAINYIAIIDLEFKIHGKSKIRNSEKAGEYKRKLFALFMDLSDQSTWDLPLQNINDFNKEMSNKEQNMSKK